MSSAMDALESFAYVNDNVPLWLSKLDDLAASVQEHHTQFLEMARSGNRLLKRKNVSTESLRENPVSHNHAIEGETAGEATGVYVPPNPSYRCLSYAARARKAANISALVRKRKGSDASIGSDPPHYRTKSMVVVYYDSAVQEAFESLFRSVAGARNNLRKGKTAASFKARMASLGVEEVPVSVAGRASTLNPKMMMVGLRRRTLGPDLDANDKLSTFDEADNDLEIIQSLCEVAAHQFLRDGDCGLEIEGMRKKFEDCRSIAKREAERLKEEEEQERREEVVVAEPNREEQLRVVTEVPASGDISLPLKEFNLPATGVIEIDDGSDPESVHIDFSVFRTRTRRV